MCHGGFYTNERKQRGINADVIPLTKIHWWSSVRCQQNRDALTFDNRTTAHVETAAHHGSQMTLLIMQRKQSIRQLPKRYVQTERPGIESTATASD